MRRLGLALCLAVVATAAQAQTFDERFPKPSPENPSLVAAVRSWFAARSGTTGTVHAHIDHHPATAVATTAYAARTAESEEPIVPRVVATLTIMPRLLTGTNTGTKKHGCVGGERIISAFYWEGKHTANGERFDPDGMTAAHRTFPFGTRLLVTNPRNGKSVTVTINDRGPFTHGVTLDLTRGAAKAIGLQGTGAVCMAKM